MSYERSRKAVDASTAASSTAERSREQATKEFSAAEQEEDTWKRSTLRPNMSRLKVGDEETLPLKGTQVHIRIDGFRARVLIDHFYQNNYNRTMEGTFQLRLPDGARPFFLGFGRSSIQADYLPDHLKSTSKTDRRGQERLTPKTILERREQGWRDVKVARMVPREKAARAYKETVRDQVDPALMEWSGTGVFRARVFPLFSNQLHRIVIGYDVNLLRTASGSLLRHTLPNDVDNKRVSVSVRGHSRNDIQVKPTTAARTLPDRIRYVYENPDANRISVTMQEPSSQLLAGTDEETGAYFAGRFQADLPEVQAGSRSDALFLLDTSLSSQPDRFNIWLKLLKAILEQNRDRIQRFNILFFNVETRWWKSGMVPNSADRVREALDALRRTVLEGGTDLQATLKQAMAGPPNRRNETKAPNLFLLSDGAPTWGPQQRRQLQRAIPRSFGGRLYAYQTGLSGTDVRILNGLTSHTGGAVFSVTSESEISDASTAHRTLPWKVEQIKATDGSDVLLAGKPDVLYPGQTVTFAGRGAPDRNMTVKLTLSRGDRKRTLSWSPSDRTTSPMTPRLYGQIAVNQLEANAWSRKHAKPYALHFRIPGETSSLLMLENEEDYQQFDIEPEENRSFIRTSPVRQLLNRRDRKSARPDTPLFTLLDRLEQTQHEVSLPASLRRLLEKKPSSFFSVDPRPLSTTVRTYDQLRNRYREALSDGEVSYDDVYEQVHRLRGDNRTDDAVRALSSLIEQHPGHTGHLRDVGYTLMAWEQPAHAYHLLLRSAMKRPGEPQVYLACARLLEQTGNVLQALAFYEIAHRGEWHDRFQQFQTVVAMEYNRFLEEHSGRSLPEEVSELISERKRGFRTATDLNSVDVATWIVWNTDRSDVDLHVEESTGEECYYENRTTDIGGWLTKDVTQGYGPELYVLEQAKPGAYEIWANYYSSTDDRVELRTRVFALVYRREPDGTLNTRRTVLTLDGTSDYEYIDEFEFRNEVQK